VALVVKEVGDMFFYINGSLVGTGDVGRSPVANTEELTIGAFETGSSPFNGSIDEVRIYNRSLDIKEILALSESRTNLVLSNLTRKGDNWTVAGYPTDGYSIGSSQTSGILIENTPPTATITSPVDGVMGNVNISSVGSAVDDDNDFVSCNLYINGTINATNSSMTLDVSTTIISNISTDGVYEWYWNCTDGEDYNTTIPRAYTLDTNAPVVSIIYPTGGLNISSNSIGLNASATDNFNSSSRSYYWVINGTTNTTTTDSNSTLNASDGYYNLTLFVSDGLQNGSDTVYFRLDTTSPSFSNNWTNASLIRINGNVAFNITISDYGSGLRYYAFSWNGTGSWNNDTNGTISASSAKLIINKSTSLRRGNTIAYIWYANDFADNWNNSLLRAFIVANTPPTTPNVTYPVNNTIYNDIPYINYSSTDADGDSINYSIYINGSLNMTIATNLTSWNASDGYYNLTVSANDGADSSSNSSSVYFTLDTTAPVVSLNSPDAGYYNDTFANTFFDCTASDANEVANLSFYMTDSTNESFALNQTNTSSMALNTFNATHNLSIGNYTWNCYSCDIIGNCNFALGNRTVEMRPLDTIAPTIALISPADNIWDSDGSVAFQYIPTDTHLGSCILYHNTSGTWLMNYTNSTPVSGSQDSITQYLNDGVYIWNVWCNDTRGNSAFSPANYTIKIDTIPPTMCGALYYGASYGSNFEYTCTATDSGSGIGTYTINETTDFSINPVTGFVTNITPLLPNVWYINLTANDSAGNENSVIWTINISDTNAPVLDILYPLDTYYQNLSWINLSIRDDFPGNITINDSRWISVFSNETHNSFYNGTTQPEGNYTIEISYNDTYGNTGHYNLTYVIDRTSPITSLVHPPNGSTWSSSSNVTFTYNVTDLNPIAQCYIDLDSDVGGYGSSDIGTPRNQNVTYSHILADGNWVWFVNCTDEAGNYHVSEIWNVTVAVTVPPVVPPAGGIIPGGRAGPVAEEAGIMEEKAKEEILFLQRLFHGEKNPDNGICDDGENYLIDDDCEFIAESFMSGTIFFTMWFIRFALFATVFLFLMGSNVFPAGVMLVAGLFTINNAFGIMKAPAIAAECGTFTGFFKDFGTCIWPTYPLVGWAIGLVILCVVMYLLWKYPSSARTTAIVTGLLFFASVAFGMIKLPKAVLDEAIQCNTLTSFFSNFGACTWPAQPAFGWAIGLGILVLILYKIWSYVPRRG
ncbi:MAG: LamG domain-containing protein, partial [Nanoarchaeota archaeon]|nr:LamG domain-containing protein [Nanoarchaeota archaeon]